MKKHLNTLFVTLEGAYLRKDGAAVELVSAVRKVTAGGAYVSASLAERVVQQLNGAVQVPRHAELSASWHPAQGALAT